MHKVSAKAKMALTLFADGVPFHLIAHRLEWTEKETVRSILRTVELWDIPATPSQIKGKNGWRIVDKWLFKREAAEKENTMDDPMF